MSLSATYFRISFLAIVALGAVKAGAATRLDLTPANAAGVAADYVFAPQGDWIVFRAAVPNQGSADLYCLAASGGLPTRLSADLPSDRSIAFWQLSPGGGHVVYFADQDLLHRDEVYVVPMPDGEFYKVNDPLVEFGSTAGAFAGTAGDRIAYVAGKVSGPFSGTFYELFSVPTSGGESLRLSGEMASGGDVQHIVVRPDGGRVVYLADQEVDEKLELYSVDIGGGAAVKLNPELNVVSDVVRDGLAFSPDGSRVIFQVDLWPEQRNELYSVSALGGTATPVHPPLSPGSSVTRGSQQFSPDGARVLYHADQNFDEVFEIFTVPASGGASVRLNGPLVVNGDVNALSVKFSSNSARVLYTADQMVDGIDELFCVPSAGGTAVKLSGDTVAGGDVQLDAQFSPDSSRVLFRADRRFDDVIELFSTPITGGQPTLLSGPLVINGDVVRAEFTPDGREVVYLADQDVDEVFELFAVPATGGTVRKISGPLVAGGDVLDWKFSPDGSQLVYRADQEVEGLFQLYSVEFNVGSAPLPGDFNVDGVVDAADYTKWRDRLGSLFSAADYTTWKSNFGRRAGVGASAGEVVASVPEPASTLSLLAAAAGGLNFRCRQSSQSCSFSRAGT